MRPATSLTLVVFLTALLAASARAQSAPEPPSGREALEIISTHERIKAGLYKIIRITPGSLQDRDGFITGSVIRVSAFAPASAGRPKRSIKHYLMYHNEEYGWFIECEGEDARGVYLEISSQKKGRVFVR